MTDREKKKKILTELMHDPIYKPMKLKELAMLLDLEKERRDELKELLTELVNDGKIGLSPKGKYGKPELFSVTGTFTGNSRGFGFVTVEGRDDDIFISPENTGKALNGDLVRIVIEREKDEKLGKRAEGKVLNVLEHANKEVVGIYKKNKNFGFVIPDNLKIASDIFIPQGKDMGAETGHKVVVKITDYGSEKRSPEGVIKEIIGNVNDPGVDIGSIVRSYDLPEEFPKEVLKEVKDIPEAVTERQEKGRVDLRGLQTVTIDGDDAKDLDDAVTLSYDEDTGLYTLGVHIADVTAYVEEGSALDKEALKRGTSVYLPDRVIPMLPKKLSNGICSLNAGVDRLKLSCIMKINKEGEITDHEICESVINVDRRMSYKNVYAIIGKNDARRKEQYKEFVPMFMLMKELSEILRKRRENRGGIDFDFPESKITLDAKGRPVKIEPYERNAANMLIEDFMLAANETVAEDCYWRQLPFLYRTHESPDPDKIRELYILISNFGYFLKQSKNEEIRPKQIRKLLEKIKGSREEALIERLVLRSMKKAVYTTECTGHFGLAAGYYCHFTSPIRRYPDLQIHRIIKESLRGELGKKRTAHYEKILKNVAVKTSELERRADEAERESEKMKKAEYMRGFIDEEFEGIISGVTSYGFYVELPNTCEGLVHVNTLTDDYYIFDEAKLELKGERTGKSYKLGQEIRVRVTNADKVMRTVDFMVAEDGKEQYTLDSEQ